MSAASISVEVAAARLRQFRDRADDHPDGTGPNFAADAKHAASAALYAARQHTLTWRHLLRAEYTEAMAQADPAHLRADLVALAAVTVAWVEAIDRRLDR